MLALIIKELKLIRKDKRSFIFLLLMPAVFIFMFGTLFNNTDNSAPITVRMVDQDHSAASAAFLEQAGRIVKVKQEDPADLDSLQSKIKQGQFSALLIIPQGFEHALKSDQAAELTLIEDPSAAAELMPVRAILDSLSKQYREEKLAGLLASKGESDVKVKADLASPITVKEISTDSDHFNLLDQVVPGMTVMFVFYIMITMARRFFDEKKTGLLARITATRVKPLEYLVGMWIPFLLTIIAQCCILFALGHFAYHLELGSLPALAVIVLGLAICGSGLGLALSFLVPGEGAAMVITQVFSMGGAMIGGLWTPSYLLPEGVQAASRFLPQYWAQHALQDIIVHGALPGDILGPLAVLLTFGLAGLTAAFLRLPAFLRSAAN
ncbi:ABC transporter permease [Gorillibacterium sp. sgz5001074]|uniref:ABC transporter permease n=1 Tax=Gorillibacterium sp. sgz5001074 TaxID=3446695 RepID=UPI003F67BDAC